MWRKVNRIYWTPVKVLLSVSFVSVEEIRLQILCEKREKAH